MPWPSALSGPVPATAYWAGNIDGNWNTQDNQHVATNWRTDATSDTDTFAVPGSTTNVYFYTSNPAAGHFARDGPGVRTSRSIRSPSAAEVLTSAVTFNSGNTLTINGVGGLTVNSGAGAVTLNNNFSLGAAQTLDQQLRQPPHHRRRSGQRREQPDSRPGPGHHHQRSAGRRFRGSHQDRRWHPDHHRREHLLGRHNGQRRHARPHNVTLGASTSVVISSGATLQYNVTGGITQATLPSPLGTLQKIGSGVLTFGGAGTINWNLGAGALIDVQGGTLVGGSSAQDNWTNNLASLNIASGATFSGVEAAVRVDALTGAGTFTGGYNGNINETIGVNNGSGTFSGALQNDTARGGRSLSLTKIGTGVQVLSGANTYTGPTTISAGTLNAANVLALGATGSTVYLQATASILELSTDTAFGGGNPVYNVSLTNGGGAYSPTIILNRATAGASNSLTQQFGTLTMVENGGQPLTLNVTKGSSGASGLDTLAFTGLAAGNNNPVAETLVPTGGNLSFGTVQASGAAGVTVDLDGTTSGNAITGVIGGGAGGGIAITKTNTSTSTSPAQTPTPAAQR